MNADHSFLGNLITNVRSKENFADGRVGVPIRHLVGIDATFAQLLATQLQPQRPDMPQSCSGLAH